MSDHDEVFSRSNSDSHGVYQLLIQNRQCHILDECHLQKDRALPALVRPKTLATSAREIPKKPILGVSNSNPFAKDLILEPLIVFPIDQQQESRRISYPNIRS